MNQLKEAEKTASQMVANARKEQSLRLSEAKVEADKIISAYRADLEAKHITAHTKVQGNAGQQGLEINAKTDKEIAAMQADFAVKRGAVEDALVAAVCNVEFNVRPARPQNTNN